jgi:type VI secretion system protein ImpF
MSEGSKNVTFSLLDRLIDEEPKVSREPVQNRLADMAQLKSSLVRDLERLLNSRRNIFEPPAAYRWVNQSLFVYGLSDFTGENPKNPFAKQKLRQEIEKTLSRFESRLKKIRVEFEVAGENARSLRFRISGVISVSKVREPVSFDTYLDVNRGQFLISK